eukprot:UN15049
MKKNHCLHHIVSVRYVKGEKNFFCGQKVTHLLELCLRVNMVQR